MWLLKEKQKQTKPASKIPRQCWRTEGDIPNNSAPDVWSAGENVTEITEDTPLDENTEDTPLHLFMKFLSKEKIDLLVAESNRYAAQKIKITKLSLFTE